MKLGTSQGQLDEIRGRDRYGNDIVIHPGSISYEHALCVLCNAPFDGKQSDARLREHFEIEHGRKLVSRNEHIWKDRDGRRHVTVIYGGVGWKNDTEDGINKTKRGRR